MWKHLTTTKLKDYFISSTGQVKSVSRFNKKEKLIKLSINSSGYLTCFIEGPKLVHRLVAEVFVQKIEVGKTVNHKDGNKQNNNFENLEVVSMSDNIKHAMVQGINPTVGNTNKDLIITDEQVNTVRELWNGSKEEVGSFAKEYGATYATMRRILLNKRRTLLCTPTSEEKVKLFSSTCRAKANKIEDKTQ